MEKIFTLVEANRYLETVEVNVWELEERVGRLSDPQPRMKLPFPTFEFAKSIGEALQRLRNLVQRRQASIRFIDAQPKEVKDAEMDHWRKEMETFKEFNAIVQGYSPPHR
jgi:hypothetical protein